MRKVPLLEGVTLVGCRTPRADWRKEHGMARFGTRAIHGVKLPAPSERPLSAPIWQNPTTAALEGLMADLEGGVEATATASGMGAIASVLLGLASAGDHLLLQRDLYGGTFSLATVVASRLGVDTSFVDATDPIAVKEALRPSTRAIYVETIANPTMTVADLPAVGEVAREAGVPLVVDNTVASPYLCRPIEHGASVVVHSATKYLGGQSDVVGGVAVFADKGLHHRAWKTMLDIGASADPFAAWLLLRGIKTLPLRMERHTANAAAVAGTLADHPKVERVYWPGLTGHPTHEVAKRVLDGYGGMVSFDLRGGRAAGRRFIEATRVAKLAASLGGLETLVAHPASTTHRQLDAGALAAAGIGEGMVRMSVGLEDAADLLEDLTAALEVA